MIPTQISECCDLHCKDEVHLEAVDWLATEILESVQSAAEETLPCPKAGGGEKKTKITPGFNQKVKPHNDTVFFWHSIWKSAGRPINTQLYKIMK